MFVLTVDQVGSRRDGDRVAAVLADDRAWAARGVVLGPDRTAGDEFQLVLASAGAALRTALDLTADGRWSVGIGVGGVDAPLPASTREATGDAFVSARAAVEAAKRARHRCVVEADAHPEAAADATALLQLLLDLRSRRSPEGRAVAALLADGLTQAEIAVRLDVTPQAVSQRSRTAGLRLEQAAAPALERVLAALDGDGDVGAAP